MPKRADRERPKVPRVALRGLEVGRDFRATITGTVIGPDKHGRTLVKITASPWAFAISPDFQVEPIGE